MIEPENLSRFRTILNRSAYATACGYDIEEAALMLEGVLNDVEERLNQLYEQERIVRGFPPPDSDHEDVVVDAVAETVEGRFLDNVQNVISLAAHLAGVVWIAEERIRKIASATLIDWDWEKSES